MSPVRRHLASAGVWVGLRANRAEQHFKRRHAKLQTQGAVAVVSVKPIIARTERKPRRRQDGFMSGAADLKKNFILSLELNFLVVNAPGEIHRAIYPDELLRLESVIFLQQWLSVHGVGLLCG